MNNLIAIMGSSLLITGILFVFTSPLFRRWFGSDIEQYFKGIFVLIYIVCCLVLIGCFRKYLLPFVPKKNNKTKKELKNK